MSLVKTAYGPVVQRLERLTVYQDVTGSNPVGVAKGISLVRELAVPERAMSK